MAKIKDDNKIPEILRQLKKASDCVVEIGILGRDADENEIATYAAANEFGTNRAGRNRKVRIPERSFLRSSVDDKGNRDKTFRDAARFFDLGINPLKVYESMGETMVGFVKRKINSNVGPKNKPSTIRRKGSAGTLRDTKDMAKAIDYQVVRA